MKTKLEIEIEKLHQLRSFHENTHSTISVLEANLEAMMSERESIATAQLLGGTAINLSSIDKKITEGEQQIKRLQNQLIFEKNTIEKLRTEVIPKIEVEEKVEIYHSKNQELKQLIESFNYDGLNNFINQIQIIRDKCFEICRETRMDGRLRDNQQLAGYLDNNLNKFNDLLNITPAPVFQVIQNHLNSTIVSSLEQNLINYAKERPNSMYRY